MKPAEAAFTGPTLLFEEDNVIAVTGETFSRN